MLHCRAYAVVWRSVDPIRTSTGETMTKPEGYMSQKPHYDDEYTFEVSLNEDGSIRLAYNHPRTGIYYPHVINVKEDGTLWEVDEHQGVGVTDRPVNLHHKLWAILTYSEKRK
jgi:hypothetical protein